jgi:hypothetical protein
MPYKYVVEVDSRSFAEAPPLVLNVLRRLSWAAREALGSEPMQQFNEMLAVGYFEEQKMNVRFRSKKPLKFLPNLH